MSDLEQIIMEEISSLEELRLIDVIGFIRYLKAEKPIQQEQMADWYENALQSIREREQELKITPKDITEQAKRNRSE